MNIQLSISLLVSDRMETLGKCLASLKPLLRELDSELIAVFTGKNEETLNLLRQYTSQVIPFTWCNDFSKARNVGLKEARGEWFMYLDDDEWFDDTTEIIQFFKSGEYRNYQCAFYVERNYMDLEGKRYYDADVGRMCRLTPETTFVFPIHENLCPFHEPDKKLKAFVHHFGYARKDRENLENTKTSRNLPLLLEMLEKNPKSPQSCMQIAQEYRSIGEYDNAIRYCRRGLEYARKEKRIYNYELWLQVNLPMLISYTGDLELALKEAEQLLVLPRTLEVASAYLCVTLVASCRDLKKYRKGLKYVRLYHEKILYLRKNPDAALRQRAVGVTMDNVAEEEAPVYVEGLFFSTEAGDLESVCEILSWLPWEDESRISPLYPRLEEWKKKYPQIQNEILAGYDRLYTNNLYVCLQKCLHAEKCGEIQKSLNLWTICAESCPPGFQWELIEIAVRNSFSLNPLVSRMSPEVWNEYTAATAKHKETKTLEQFYEKINPLLEKYPFYARKLEQCCLERLLTSELLESARPAVLLEQYCESVLTDAEALYRPEVLAAPETYALPSQYRFAAIVKDALVLFNKGDLTGCIPLLNVAVQVYPRMSVAVSQLLRSLEEQMHSSQRTVPEEFLLLGNQVKQVLYDLMEKKQWEEAYGVSAQLVSLLPDDLDVLRMKQEILHHGTPPVEKNW